MIANIVIASLIGIWLFINISKMVNNVRNGRSIDGCDGDCLHCATSSCHH